MLRAYLIAPLGQRPIPYRRSMLCLACCLGIALLGGRRQEEAKINRLSPVKVQPVKLVKYTPGVTLTGEISARIQSELSFRLSGQVIERKVDVGANVQGGHVLARGPKVQEDDVEGAAAAVQAAEAKLCQVASAFERQKALLKDGFTTQREFDQAEQEDRSAQAMLDSAKAQLAGARDQLAQTVLRAPSAGVITARNIEVGEGSSRARPRSRWPRTVHGMPSSTFRNPFSPPAFTTASKSRSSPIPKSNGGEVREIAPAINAMGGIRVKIGLSQTPAEMVLGSAVRVTAHAQEQEMAVLPWSALYADGDKPAVWVVDPRSRRPRRRIEIEAYENSGIVIRGGLRPGEIVVTVGTQLLRSAQQVAFAEDNQ